MPVAQPNPRIAVPATSLPTCPNCGGRMETFYAVEGTPVHSVLLMETRRRGAGYPTGEIQLALCPHCGFVSNVAFKPELHEYSQKYESTQSYSPTFNALSTAIWRRR